MTYALISGCVAAIVALAAGYPLVGFLRERKLGKAISSEGPQSHMVKAGTPTMGGLLIMGVVIAAGLIAAVPKDATSSCRSASPPCSRSSACTTTSARSSTARSARRTTAPA